MTESNNTYTYGKFILAGGVGGFKIPGVEFNLAQLLHGEPALDRHGPPGRAEVVREAEQRARQETETGSCRPTPSWHW